jgi:hypothetical protein
MPTKWFSDLGAELKNWSLVGLEPSFDVRASDHIVGTADNELKKLYELSIQYEKSGFESFVAAQHAKTKENFEYHAKKASEWHRKHEILMESFWVSIRDSFNLWDKSSVGIRKNWEIVWYDEEEEEEKPEPESEQHKIVIIPAMSLN